MLLATISIFLIIEAYTQAIVFAELAIASAPELSLVICVSLGKMITTLSKWVYEVIPV